MVKAYDYYKWENLGKKIILHMKNGDIEKGVFLDYDDAEDNDIGDGFILDVDGDTSIGRLVLEKDVERVDIGDDKGTYVNVERDTKQVTEESEADQIKVHQAKNGIHGTPNRNKEG